MEGPLPLWLQFDMPSDFGLDGTGGFGGVNKEKFMAYACFLDVSTVSHLRPAVL